MIKWFILIYFLAYSPMWAHETLKIGSKRFTESYILSEIIKQVAEQTGEVEVIYKPGLGNTGIAFTALQEGSIDIYPEYSGTIIQEFLRLPISKKIDLKTLNDKLHPLGIGADILLGFNNTYALAMREDKARELHIHRISDLVKYPHLKIGFSQEFLKRTDGWEELKKAYYLPKQDVIGIDHSLSYEALVSKQIDLIDVYSTDPKIEKYNLFVLEDDRHFFPHYDALLLYRLDVPDKFPRTWKALQSLEGTITNEKILIMNAQAELLGESFEWIAQRFLPAKEVSMESPYKRVSFLSLLFESNLWNLTKQHLFLVFGSLIPAILVGILLGVLAAHSFSSRYFILHLVGVIQTIPSLAFFAFLIPLLQQIGTIPALIALFFYALLPIVRNTYTGLNDIPKPLKESAIVLGLPLLPRLVFIDIPLASRTILAGIKTAAVINVGMATIAALIGAGGLGDRIITGLALNDSRILLSGAIPACLLAILVQLCFDLLDYRLVPKGLK